jgi:nucleotide-binding universal stress UspA family protein
MAAMEIKKIVVAVDFSDESEIAVRQALALARRTGANLTLLHVGTVPERPAGIPVSMQSTVAEYMRIVDEYLAEDRRRLEELRQRISGQGVEVSHMVIDGIPDKGICKAAEEMGADLVVTGTHGRTGIKRFFLGSVAEHVVRTSRASVMVARPVESLAGGIKRILVTTDFSDMGERALEAALAVAAAGATVDLLHCWYLPPMSYPYYAPTKSAADLVTSIRESITKGNVELSEKLIARHQDSGCKLAFHQIESAPAPGIQEWLEKHPYDLVVTGSHGRRGPSRLLLGSVAEMTVRHAPCSVLVVHAQPGENDSGENNSGENE